MHFAIDKQINAAPDRIWSKLTDRNVLLNGGFGILKFEGDITPGAKIKLWSEASPNRAFPLRISAFDPGKLMIWEGGMPLGLFKGVRRFEIFGNKSGPSRFTMREDYTGLLAGLIGKSIPDLNPSFEKFAHALKRASEGA
jgi:hypothetical protein